MNLNLPRPPSEAVLRGLEEADLFKPYEADTLTGALTKTIATKGPGYMLPGAALKMPKLLNAATSVGAPATGELAYQSVLNNQKSNKPAAEEMRMMTEVATSLGLPVGQAAWNAGARAKAAHTRLPLDEIVPPQPVFPEANGQKGTRYTSHRFRLPLKG